MTLNKRIRDYLARNDLGCDVDKKHIIEQCIKAYKKLASELDDHYLDCMNNDLVKMIGYKVQLMEKKDLHGVNIWNELNLRMYEGIELSEQKIIELLEEAPLCFLLSFYGYASYRATILE
jgi:hypothetical protein